MRFSIACCLAILASFAAGCGSAADGPKLKPADRVQELVKTHKQAMADYGKARDAAKTDAERQAIDAKLGPPSAAEHYADQFLAIVRENPQDPAALDALSWMFRYVPHSRQADEAVKIVVPIWAADARLEPVCRSLTYLPCPAGDKLLRAALEKNPDRNVQGLACFALAASQVYQAERLGDADAAARHTHEREAETMFERVASEYADVKRSTTLGEEAAKELFALRNLAVGKTVPEIDGEDIDGERMKLSEHRGKVVLLVFWASWCGPCMADVPHERELAERFEGQPFAIVGVNGDEDREAALAAVSKTAMTWRSYWNSAGSHGPIPSQWNVHGWPTLYLIDAHGVIRYKGNYLRRHLFEKDKDGKPRLVHVLDEAVDTLMREVNGQRASR